MLVVCPRGVYILPRVKALVWLCGLFRLTHFCQPRASLAKAIGRGKRANASPALTTTNKERSHGIL